MKRDSFAEHNPLDTFLFFVGTIVFGMFFVHPIFLACSCFFSMTYYVLIRGVKAVKVILGMIPVFILVSIINPFFNVYGSTVLFTVFGGRPYTLEALYYGMAIGAMLVAILIWFGCYNHVMTSDKFMYLFGGTMPSISLVLTMVLRLVPNIQRKAAQISSERKSVGKSAGDGSTRAKVKNGLIIVSALTSWALEGGIITADSMRSRGYGCGKRTFFSIYKFDSRDISLLLLMAVLMAIVIICGLKGAAKATYTPDFFISGVTEEGVDGIWFPVGIIAYGAFLALPSTINILEEIKWRILRLRI